MRWSGEREPRRIGKEHDCRYRSRCEADKGEAGVLA
jgi:hypothetical protein